MNDILNGECLYFRSVPNKKFPQYAMPINVLPSDIVAAFERVFNYTAATALQNAKNRTAAEEWCRTLLPYATPQPNSHLKTCAIDSKHVYAAHNTTCPWCNLEKRTSPVHTPRIKADPFRRFLRFPKFGKHHPKRRFTSTKGNSTTKKTKKKG